jgi:two-component system response regulator YesN
MLEQSETDLILSDLVMTEMGGLELCRKLRRKNNHVKVIILTGYVAEETLEELRALAVLDCLGKPVQVEQLLRALEKVW